MDSVARFGMVFADHKGLVTIMDGICVTATTVTTPIKLPIKLPIRSDINKAKCHRTLVPLCSGLYSNRIVTYSNKMVTLKCPKVAFRWDSFFKMSILHRIT